MNAFLFALGIGDLVPIVGMLVPITVFLIPIVAILTSHQRKMAQIIHAKESATQSAEVQALRQEVAELKSMVYQQMLALDGYANPRQPDAQTSPAATGDRGVRLDSGRVAE
ncbi:MAG: hypothetical protein SNJ74_07010 [Fimbriimonadaceae bacterium]